MEKNILAFHNLSILLSYIDNYRKEGENMNYADIKKVDVANGEGVRVSIFVSRM